MRFSETTDNRILDELGAALGSVVSKVDAPTFRGAVVAVASELSPPVREVQ